MSAIFSGLVVAGMTATNGSPSMRAKYASLTAVDPLEASTTVRALGDLPVAQRVEEQRPRQPVLEAAGGVGRLVLEVEVDAPLGGQRVDQQVGVGAAVGVGLDRLDRPVHPGPARPGPSGRRSGGELDRSRSPELRTPVSGR